MTPCLKPDEFIDLLDDNADAACAAHLDSCAECRATLAEVRAALHLAESASVPEPSPFFWPQLNARIRSAIAEQSPASRGAWTWLRWDVVVPLAGLTTIVVALATAVNRVPTATPAAAVVAVAGSADATPAAAESTATDDALALMIDLAATVSEREWESLGVARLPDMGVAAETLADDERRELRALLKSAVERSSS